MNRIEATFRKLKSAKKKAFIAFITAGYPDLKTTERLVLELARAGADIIELGVPFSDPLADGPVIQEASQKALEKGVTLAKIFALVKKLRCSTQVPICFMSYYNPIYAFGEERFCRTAKASGVDGVIIPDLPPEEAKNFSRCASVARLDTVFFAAPTTSTKRLKAIAERSRGFIYYISLTGVTGARRDLPPDVQRHVRQLKKLTAKPVCVGFGVSTPAQVRQVQAVADGVIVGSAIVRTIKENIGKKDLVAKVGRFVRSLRGV